MSEHCIKTGAVVFLPDYGVMCPADIFAVGESRVIRFPYDPVAYGERDLFNAPRPITHELNLNGSTNFWRKDLGVAVVQQHDLKEVTDKTEV